MARLTRRIRQSRRTIKLDFAAIEVVGALLPPDIITRIAAFDTPEQTTDNYGLLPGLKLRDEIARYYQIAQAHWETFVAARAMQTNAPEAFVLKLLTDCFGFANIKQRSTAMVAERRFPIRHFAEVGRIPIVIAPQPAADSRRAGIDEALTQFGDESRRRSSTQLLQEFLNAEDDALWGITTDGSVLRLLRDNASLTRPAWIEVNIEKVFTEGLFPDFSALWLLLHATRFGTAGTATTDCALERWKERGRIDGAAAKDKLRLGVEAALLEFGRGFLEHPSNADLRAKFQTGELTRQAFFEELLRLVYRLIFLYAAEDRNLLHSPGTSDAARKAYRAGYGLDRLRERCTKNHALDRHGDAWAGMRALFTALAEGEPRLGLVALGGLFEPEKLALLTDCKIENRRFLKGIWHLSWFRPEGQPMTKVNWRDMETEELGSVYESLLELTPVVHVEAREFTFAEGDATRGNARKVSGSYYTPDSLVTLLLDTTLNPVLDAAEARNPSDPPSEILKLSFIDPACGSGHFLLGAARRAAERIARHRSPGAPSQEVFQHALREVVSHCIYGTDRNPMAVELCKVALWIEALEPGKPLSFLDSRILCGDSLIGVFDFEMLRAGIPDDAYAAMTGDDKAVAKAYERLNRDQREDKVATGMIKALSAPTLIIDGAARIAAMPEETLGQVKEKALAFFRMTDSSQWRALWAACDMYVAAFFAPKTGAEPTARSLPDLPVPTTEAVWRCASGGEVSDTKWKAATDIAREASALHWPLAFPQVMWRGGFDAVIGNPPWERIKLQEQEFFAARSAEIANAKNKAARDKLITALSKAAPGTPEQRLYANFVTAKRAAEAASFFMRRSGRFPLTGTGDVNTYALFAEHFANLARQPKGDGPAGRAGVIVPTGIATDSSTSAFFGNLVSTQRLTALFDFENREKLFAAVDSRMKFSILSIGPSAVAEFAFFLLNTAMMEDKERRFMLSPEQISKINPNTKTAPVFRSRADAELTTKLYQRAPVLISDQAPPDGSDPNPWGITFQTMFHMSNDSDCFEGAAELDAKGFTRSGTDWEHGDGRRFVPLYEAKMIHHYDHRWATYVGADEEEGTRDVTLSEKQNPDFEPNPRYWVPEDEVRLRAARVPARLKSAYRKGDADGCLSVLAEWVLGSTPGLDPQNVIRSVRPAEERLIATLGRRAVHADVVGRSLATWIGKVAERARDMQRETPLTDDDLLFVKEGPKPILEIADVLLDRFQPRWLFGWRNITNVTNERTVISSIFPRVAVGHSTPLAFTPKSAECVATFAANFTSLVFDYIARQKMGGTNLTFSYVNQFPVFPPSDFSGGSLNFVSSRVLELTYTSHAMRPWAEDLGYTGAPFAFDPDRRALLRAELDAFFARKYGLTKDELRYILDPKAVKGDAYPSETFRGLQANEMTRYGEYRTQRLVLEAFDRLTGA
ncbi:Eco57I restriction-modification methylase domain-containing protein [Cereibacter sphaeroides]|uniref:Eco57I restriction-modification methylase domain-containing protein n=1 Tax=Cereibacter sphaeroides TaxID=1063 RepID=UPI001F1FC42B|nr:N-6 DNA methylase [Cereibacter sphaeroides]MCE6967196.1 N-6 DNA methylase [Cereibacter sphaeroides]